MKLPTELRLMIFRHAVVKKDAIYTLLPPALSQVSKQLRAEVLPLYYRENEFQIYLDVDVVEYVEGLFPVRTDDETRLFLFRKMLSDVVASGGLEHVTKLRFDYSEPTFEDMSNYLLIIEFFADGVGGTRREYKRIGDDNLDWHDFDAVTKAFNVTADRSAGFHAKGLREHVPVSGVIEVLFDVAKHCDAANRDVRLSWDYGH